MSKTTGNLNECGGKVKTSLTLAIVVCWILCGLGIMGGSLDTLVIGVVYAVAALGLHKRKLWSARLALIVSVSLGIIELVVLLSSLAHVHEGLRSWLLAGNPIGRFGRLVLHVGVIAFTRLSWELIQGPCTNDYERRGTV